MKRYYGGAWQETDYGYDILANLTSITNSLNQTTTLKYDKRHDPNSVTDANNNTTTKIFDERGFLWLEHNRWAVQ